MLSAFLAGISGLRNHQLKMDVIGNNIANMNTVGFKSSRVTFEEGFAQVLAGATAERDGNGGRNPEQVGSGAHVSGIDTLFTQGALEATGQPLDLAIQGHSLFVLSDGDKVVYSRAGNFRLDGGGRLVLAGTGLAVQGISADAAGGLTGPYGDIVLDPKQSVPPQATRHIEIKGSLDATAAAGTEHVLAATVFDDTGQAIDLSLTFTARGDGRWTWSARTADPDLTVSSGGTVTFGEDGKLATFEYGEGGKGLTISRSDGTSLTIDLKPANSGLISRAGDSTAAVASQDGRRAGELVSVSVGPDGAIQGVFSNGEIRNLAKIGLARFNNVSGLSRAGGNVYEATAASGEADVDFTTAGESTIVAGALENSNVDISAEFTDMIVAQRGFQASARVITTADELLAEMIHLTR